MLGDNLDRSSLWIPTRSHPTSHADGRAGPVDDRARPRCIALFGRGYSDCQVKVAFSKRRAARSSRRIIQ